MEDDLWGVVNGRQHEPENSALMIRVQKLDAMGGRSVPGAGSQAPASAAHKVSKEPEWLIEWVRNYS